MYICIYTFKMKKDKLSKDTNKHPAPSEEAPIGISLNAPLNEEIINSPEPIWDVEKVESKLRKAYENNSEEEVLAVLKDNSFLFYDLFSRKWGVQPIFRELNFGGTFRCDFAWLNDNSSGPEWVLVEIEKPKMNLFKGDRKPTAPFQAAIEQVKSWGQYFDQNPGESKRIFGAVAQFRFILVTGAPEEWDEEYAKKWRIYHHKNSTIEIRSTQTFFNSIDVIKEHPGELWSFEEQPVTLSHSKLSEYWQNYGYMDSWRQIIT